MEITLTDLGKKFNRQWIFRHLDINVSSGEMIAVTGHNGSGKSTLLKIISNYITPSEGIINYQSGEIANPQLDFAYVAPYLNLIEEFTLEEHLMFHCKFKRKTIELNSIMEQSGLSAAKTKQVKEFSSGMKQRLKLALAFFFESEIIFLDEPTSNLDQNGVEWYLKLLEQKMNDKTIIIASNDVKEYQLAQTIIPIEKYKC